MLSITLQGPPFERGYQHGQQFPAEIRETLRVYCPDHWRSDSAVRTVERRLLSTLAARFPELVIEMTGIAKGAGIDFEAISLLNLVLATNDLDSNAISDTFKLACSAIGFAGSDVGPLVGKNCDETMKAAPFYLFQEVRPDYGPAYFCISWVGTVWAEAGMNDAGLALMQTAGPSAPEQDGHGIVCNIAPRPVLERCRTTGEGLAMLASMDVAGWGMGLMLADWHGTLAGLEKTYDRDAVITPEAEVAFCTNHFTQPAMQGTVSIAHAGLEENSRARHLTLARVLLQGTWPHSLSGMQAALGYHGPAGFVCQHGEAGLHSNYSCIAAPRRRELWLGEGYPCQGNYTRHQL